MSDHVKGDGFFILPEPIIPCAFGPNLSGGVVMTKPQDDFSEIAKSTTQQDRNLDEVCVNTLRMLSADAIQKAESGHPGLPLGAAAMAYVLWTRFLKFNPCNPHWPNRDRYVHSAGHGSALLYSLLHLCGYDISLDEMKCFRQWGSKTPGHPEYNIATGVEATTGPLGQGFSMGIGMAIAERFLAAKFNQPGFPVVDHFTFGICSDGDLMEGITSEAASLAGHLKLGKIVYLYDDNHISIEGDTSLSFTEDVGARFLAYDWHVQRVDNGNDIAAIDSAIRNAQAETTKPSLIMVRTNIGYGSPKQDKASAHGEPLGVEALRITKETFGWPVEPSFHVPADAAREFANAVDKGQKLEQTWHGLIAEYRSRFKELGEELDQVLSGKLPDNLDEIVPKFSPSDKPIATRSASGKVLNALAKVTPNMLGGSADLAPSTKTLIADSPDFSPTSETGRNLRFGVREHAMGAIVNGMALHGGVIPYGATFLIFSDYVRPSVRLAALMGVHSIFVFTHDSIAVGEDGPTHQPVEHLIALRAIPDLLVVRPADANETAQAWLVAMKAKKPVCLILTRQNLPILEETSQGKAKSLEKGAYVISDSQAPKLILLASGSEVSLAMKAKTELEKLGVSTRVVSMPCWELFKEQSQEYRDSVIPPAVTARLGIEAGSSYGWDRWIGDAGDVIAVDRFGASAPGSELMKRYGFSVENVVEKAMKVVKK
jgi:transketolase